MMKWWRRRESNRIIVCGISKLQQNDVENFSNVAHGVFTFPYLSQFGGAVGEMNPRPETNNKN
jgi:hypothetical protein